MPKGQPWRGQRVDTCPKGHNIAEVGRRNGRPGHGGGCRGCARERDKLRLRDPAKDRARRFRKEYGISLEDWQALANQQAHLCLICNEHAPLVVDHDHATGKVRGLLCAECNVGVGMFHENPSTLERAAAYIRARADAQRSLKLVKG